MFHSLVVFLEKLSMAAIDLPSSFHSLVVCGCGGLGSKIRETVFGQPCNNSADATSTPSYSSGLHILVFQDGSERGAFNIEKALK